MGAGLGEVGRPTPPPRRAVAVVGRGPVPRREGPPTPPTNGGGAQVAALQRRTAPMTPHPRPLWASLRAAGAVRPLRRGDSGMATGLLPSPVGRVRPSPARPDPRSGPVWRPLPGAPAGLGEVGRPTAPPRRAVAAVGRGPVPRRAVAVVGRGPVPRREGPPTPTTNGGGAQVAALQRRAAAHRSPPYNRRPSAARSPAGTPAAPPAQKSLHTRTGCPPAMDWAPARHVATVLAPSTTSAMGRLPASRHSTRC